MTELYEKAALLVSQSLSCVNAPDIHHAGMRIIGFKVDLAAWPKSDLCMSFPVECLLELKGLPAAVERIEAELSQALSQMEVMREALEFYADHDNWFAFYAMADSPMEDDWGDPAPGYPDGKPGRRARAALAPKEPQS